MQLTPEQINTKLDALYESYEECCDIMRTVDEQFIALQSDTLIAIQTQNVMDFTSAENRDIIENAIISKLTIAEKEAMTRAENPRLYDNYKKTKNLMKRIEKQIEMLKSRSIQYMSDRKAELYMAEHN